MGIRQHFRQIGRLVVCTKIIDLGHGVEVDMYRTFHGRFHVDVSFMYAAQGSYLRF
jgi:hypothetical protein